MARGRGKTKIEQTGVIRKLGIEHGSIIFRIPKEAVEKLGFKLNAKIIYRIDEGLHPILRVPCAMLEIIPYLPVDEFVKSSCHGKGKHQSSNNKPTCRH